MVGEARAIQASRNAAGQGQVALLESDDNAQYAAGLSANTKRIEDLSSWTAMKRQDSSFLPTVRFMRLRKELRRTLRVPTGAVPAAIAADERRAEQIIHFEEAAGRSEDERVAMRKRRREVDRQKSEVQKRAS